MSRVMFTISYKIKPELREQYLSLMREMQSHFASARKNYSVFEAKSKPDQITNQFTEVFLTNSIEEFDALEDNQDDQTQELVARLEEFIEGDGMKYTTLIESL
jgi:hypothetical protein